MLLLVAAALAVDCATRPGTAAMMEEATAVQSALEAADPQRFQDGLRRLERTVECLGEVPPLDAVASYRVYRGVQSFGAGDTDGAAREFLAARAIQPALTLPVYPADHEINGVARRYDPVRAERERLPAPRRGTLYVDGYATRDRYLEAPALVQLVTDGEVETFLLAPGQPTSYASRHPVRNSLAITSGGLSALGIGLIAASAGPRGRFESGEATTVAELDALRSQTNSLAGGGLFALTAGLSAGVGAIVLRSR